ncbi:MAG: FAD-dependent oxidoreductase [Chlamydiota bacterium]
MLPRLPPAADWQADPFCRGAYSYVSVGAAENAQHSLAAPLAGTLDFAGDATDCHGHHATVHGAMASGYRAAKQIPQDTLNPAFFVMESVDVTFRWISASAALP